MVNSTMLLISFKNNKTIKIEELANVAFVFATCTKEVRVVYLNPK